VDPALGQCLLAEGPVTREFLDTQIRVSGKGDTYLGSLLAEVRAPAEADLYALLGRGCGGVPEVDLKRCKVHVSTARSIPRETALKYKMVPIDRLGDVVCVVCSGQPNPKGIEAIRRDTGARVKMLRCPPHHLQILLRRLYDAPRDRVRPAPPPSAPQAVAAEPISKADYDRAVAEASAEAEARWEALYASGGPVRASRIARR
jgi:hypothetical protein